MRLILAITGASGAVYGIKLLQEFARFDIETHLILSEASQLTIMEETNMQVEDLHALATVGYENHQLGAIIASGSFISDAMIIAPCSMKTMADIATGSSSTLIARAADVMIKEKRQLILSPRETPLSAIHIRNMLTLSELGVYIIPPMPAFYNHPKTVDEIISHHTMKVMDALEIPFPEAKRWEGMTI